MTTPNPLLIDPLSQLESERLLMRTPRAGDGPMFLEALCETLVDLREFLGSLPWVAAEPSPDIAEVFCRNAAANFHARKDFPFLMLERKTQRLVGVVGLHRPEWEVPKLEVGYWCRKSEQGRGYVAEAVEAACAYAFSQLRAVRLEAVTDEGNIASRQVAERCGFVLEGTLRSERRAPDGTLRNTCIYARFPKAG